MQLEQVRVNLPKSAVAEVVPPSPDRLTFHTSGFGRPPGTPDWPFILRLVPPKSRKIPCSTRFGVPSVPTPYGRLTPDCAQTLQTSRPCLKARGSQVWAPYVYSSTYHLAAKTQPIILQLEQVRVSRPKPAVAKVIQPPPDHAGWRFIRLGERAAPWAGPHRTAWSTSCFGGFGVTWRVHHLPQNQR